MENKTAFSFDEGVDNINGRYLRATHVRQAGVGLWVFCCIMLLVLWVCEIAILLNYEFFSFENIWPTASHTGGLYGRIAAVIGVPVAFIAFFLLPPFIAMSFLVLWPDGKGWAIRDNAFARWYGKRRLKQKGFHYEEALFYFTTYTRHSMPLDVFEDRFTVYLPGGRQNVPYKDMYKIFTYRDLYVVRAYQKRKSWDIILDLRNVDTQKRREFKGFMKAKKAEFMDAKLVHEPWIKSSMFAQY